MPGPKLDYAQVVREVDRWYDSASMVALRSQSEANWANVLQMQRSVMPPSLTVKAETETNMTSAIVLETLQTFVAEVDSFSEYTTIVPKGQSPTAPIKAKADKVEKYATVLGQILGRSGNVKRRGIANQCIGICDVRVLQCGPAPKPSKTDELDKPFNPWKVVQPDLGTCGFPMNREGGAFVASIFCRKYEATLEDAIETYSDYGGSGKHLTFRGGLPSMEVLEERPIYESNNAWANKRVTVRELHYKGHIYHTCSDANDGKTGEVLYEAEIITGFDTAAVIIPGDDTGSTVPGMEYIAGFEAILSNQNSINYVRTFRMDLMHVVAQGGDIVVMTPGKLDAAVELGLLKPGTGRQVISIDGETVLPLQVVPNDELDKITNDLIQERTELLAAWRPILDPAVIAAATATASDIATAGQARRKTTILRNENRGSALVLAMALNTKEHYDGAGNLSLYAATTLDRPAGGQIKAGTGFDLSKDDLDFEYDVYVATKQETEAQKTAKTQDALMLQSEGVFTHDDVVATRFADVTEQNKALFNDAFMKTMQGIGAIEAAANILFLDTAQLNGYLFSPNLMPSLMNPQQLGPDGQPLAQAGGQPGASGPPGASPSASMPGAGLGQSGTPWVPGQQTFSALTEPASGGGAAVAA